MFKRRAPERMLKDALDEAACLRKLSHKVQRESHHSAVHEFGGSTDGMTGVTLYTLGKRQGGGIVSGEQHSVPHAYECVRIPYRVASLIRYLQRPAKRGVHLHGIPLHV